MEKNRLFEQDENARICQLLEQAHAGSAEAAQALLDEHYDYLLAVIRGHMCQRLRIACDSMDVMQELRILVFTKTLEADIFRSPQSLLAYLTTMAENVTRNASQKYLDTEKRTLRRRVPLAAAQNVIDRRDPTLDCELQDAWQKFLKTLPPVYRRVGHLLSRGYSEGEVAAMVHISTRTVSRVLQTIRDKCDELRCD